MFADFGVVECVCGVDTHRLAHQVCLVDATSGMVRYQGEVAASGSGYRCALGLAKRYAPDGRVWAIEGTGSYGMAWRATWSTMASGWWRWSGRSVVAVTGG